MTFNVIGAPQALVSHAVPFASPHDYKDPLNAVIDHWGDYGSTLAPWAGPGHWHGEFAGIL